jgi:hypothetical protein
LHHQAQLPDHPNGLHYHGYPGLLCVAVCQLCPLVQLPEHPAELWYHGHPGWLCCTVGHLNHLWWDSYFL